MSITTKSKNANTDHQNGENFEIKSSLGIKKCSKCGKSLDENNYQVHHLTYLKNRNVWEYPDEFLVTLCKQCHAKEHGIIPPSSGWTYMDFDDLGEMSGECEKCHTSIRFQHHLFHPDWGVLTVGKLCADNLTRTDIASKKEKEVKSYANRLKKFIVSNRWESITDCEGITSYKIRQDKYNISLLSTKKST